MMRLSDVVRLCGDRDPWVLVDPGTGAVPARWIRLRVCPDDPDDPDDDGVVTIEAARK